MKNNFIKISLGVLLLAACTLISTPTPDATSSTLTPTGSPSKSSPLPQGTTIIVTSTSDSGPGSLRQALTDAHPYDTITFDPTIFKPDAPATIFVVENQDHDVLPHIRVDHLTLDASNAGVIIDGSQAPGDWVAGLQIVNAKAVTIRGLQISNFSGPGIAISGDSINSWIGGYQSIGNGPFGQGNMLTGNRVGVDLAETGTTLNTIRGNLIGTDTTGTTALGNQGNGIIISEGAHDNIIGPDNLIAYNGECGIYIQRSDSIGNTLTQNNIHHNAGDGICLLEGGNAGILAPSILTVDLTLGLVSGISCAHCTVEIFSTHDTYEGAFREGQVNADAFGDFTFNKGAAFYKNNITSTATDANDNTSEFSWPAGLFDTYAVMLQADNPLPRFLLLTRPSNRIAFSDVRLGTGAYYPGSPNEIPNLDYLEGNLNDFINMGIKRLDTCLNENEPPINWDFPEDEIPLEFDQFINGLIDNGIAVNYLLHFWDKEGHANKKVEGLRTPRFQTEDDEQIQDFLDYVRLVVGHFEGRVQYYTIWTEPDYCGDGGIKCIQTDDYIELADQTIDVIRDADPQAKVALAPYVLQFARDDVFTILRSDVIKKFDVIQWHGIYDIFPGNDYFGDYYYEYPTLIEEINQTASASGFQGEYWGTELTWCTQQFPNCLDPPRQWEILETGKQGAKYSARFFVIQLGMDVGVGWPSLGNIAGWLWPTIRRLNTIMVGTRPTSLDVEINSTETNVSYAPDGTWQPPILEGEKMIEFGNIASYAFTDPNGDKIFALWSDAAAVENDPGVNTCLIFRDLEAGKVVGLDVLYGFEQELVSEMTNGNTIVCNLLVKDYPTIIKFIDTATP